jgi:hypothetical protein
VSRARARVAAAIASSLGAAALAALGCATDAPADSGPSCDFRSKCPTEIQRTKSDVDACNAEKGDAKCGAAFSAMESCTQAAEECLPTGKINRAKLESDCKSQIAQYRACRPAAVDAGTGG